MTKKAFIICLLIFCARPLYTMDPPGKIDRSFSDFTGINNTIFDIINDDIKSEATILRELARLLNANPNLINSIDEMDNMRPTLLHLAASHGLNNVIIFLLNGSVTLDYNKISWPIERATRLSIDITDANGQTPLFYAVQAGQTRSTQLLIEGGADSRIARGQSQTTVTHLAAKQGNNRLLEILTIDNPELLSIRDAFGETPLFYAARYGQIDTVKWLIGQGASIYERRRLSARHTYCDLNIIHTLIYNIPQHPERADKFRTIISLLLNMDMENDRHLLHDQTTTGLTPLHVAASFGLNNFVPLLLSFHSRLTEIGLPPVRSLITTRTGYTPLHSLINGFIRSSIMPASSPQTSPQNSGTKKELHTRRVTAYIKTMQALLDHDSRLLKLANNDGQRPLAFAAFNGTPEILQALIDYDAALYPDEYERSQDTTLLHSLILGLRQSLRRTQSQERCIARYLRTLHIVLTYCPRITEAPNNEGILPIVLAARYGMPELLNALLNQLLVTSLIERTPIPQTIVHALIDGFVQEPYRDETPQERQERYENVLEIIFRHDRSLLEAQNSRGQTPVMLTIRYGSYEMLEILLRRGASPYAVTSSSREERGNLLPIACTHLDRARKQMEHARNILTRLQQRARQVGIYFEHTEDGLHNADEQLERLQGQIEQEQAARYPNTEFLAEYENIRYLLTKYRDQLAMVLNLTSRYHSRRQIIYILSQAMEQRTQRAREREAEASDASSSHTMTESALRREESEWTHLSQCMIESGIDPDRIDSMIGSFIYILESSSSARAPTRSSTSPESPRTGSSSAPGLASSVITRPAQAAEASAEDQGSTILTESAFQREEAEFEIVPSIVPSSANDPADDPSLTESAIEREAAEFVPLSSSEYRSPLEALRRNPCPTVAGAFSFALIFAALANAAVNSL